MKGQRKAVRHNNFRVEKVKALERKKTNGVKEKKKEQEIEQHRLISREENTIEKSLTLQC